MAYKTSLLTRFLHGNVLFITFLAGLFLLSAPALVLASQSELNGSNYEFDPPATFYGSVFAGGTFTPISGMEVEAWIGDQLCGQANTQLLQGQVVYTINVAAEGDGAEQGCGTPGKVITFQIEGQVMHPDGIWNNQHVQELDLSPLTSAPIAKDDAFEIDEDQGLLLDVLANDIGDQLSVDSIGQPAHGMAEIKNNAVYYVPGLNYYGMDSFVYTVRNIDGLTATATISLAIAPVNDAPEISSLEDQVAPPGETLNDLVVTLSDVDDLASDLQLNAESSNAAVIGAAGIHISGDGWSRSLALIPEQIGESVITLTVSDGELSASTQFTLTVAAEAYTVTVGNIGNCSVSLNPERGFYLYNSLITVTAIPDPGWSFSGWSGALSGNANPKTLTIIGNTTVTATFIQETYIFTIDVTGNGIVNRMPQKDTYQYGDVVTFTATPDRLWKFVGWSGDLVSSQNPLEVIVQGNIHLTANFITYRVILSLIMKNFSP